MERILSDKNFLGTGWSFPPSFGLSGTDVLMVSAEEDVQQSLNLLLSTQLGERLMHADFGWKRDALMFEPLSTTFASFLIDDIKTAVLFYESRISLDNVSMSPSSMNEGVIEISLDYTVRATNSRSNLVYPFYLDEATNI